MNFLGTRKANRNASNKIKKNLRTQFTRNHQAAEKSIKERYNASPEGLAEAEAKTKEAIENILKKGKQLGYNPSWQYLISMLKSKHPEIVKMAQEGLDRFAVVEPKLEQEQQERYNREHPKRRTYSPFLSHSQYNNRGGGNKRKTRRVYLRK